jgi:hypothetical protein
MATKKMSEMATITSPTGAERILSQGADGLVILLSKIAEYSNNLLLTAAADTPTSGDDLLSVRGGVAGTMDLDALTLYGTDKQWTDAAELTPNLTGDRLLVNRSGTKYWSNIDTLRTYINLTAQADVLDLTGLTAGTISDTDLILIGEGSTALKETALDMSTYVMGKLQSTIAGYSAITTIAGADKLYIDDDGTAKYTTATTLATFMETTISANICEDVWDNAAGAIDPVLGTDVFVLERSGTRYTALGSVIGAYTTSLLSGAAAVTPAATGDDFCIFRSGVAKTLDIDVFSTYAMDYAASNASAQSPALGTDGILIDRAGAMEKVTADVLGTYILTGVQADVLNISGLSTSTLGDSLLMPTCNVTVGEKTTVGALKNYIQQSMGTFIEGLTDGNPVVDGDFILISRSSQEYYINADDFATYMITEFWDQTAGTTIAASDKFMINRSGTGYRTFTLSDISTYVEAQVSAAYDANWSTISTGSYTATPASTSQINMSDTTGFKVGLGVRYTYGGSTYYGQVETVSANTNITVHGAPLDVGQDLTALELASQAMVEKVEIPIEGNYLAPWHTVDAEASKDIIAEVARKYKAWRHGPAHMVDMAVTQRNADTTSQPYFNIKINGVLALADNTNKGPQVSATPGTWTRAAHGFTAGSVDIAKGQAFEVLCTPGATLTGNAADVSVELTFVLE